MKNTIKSDKSIDVPKLLASLEEVASKLGIKIRYEKLAGGPIKSTHGSCLIRTEKVVIIDKRLSELEKLFALKGELLRFDLEGVFISPAAREFLQLENAGNGGEDAQKG